MLKRFLLVCMTGISIVSTIFAGDIATLVNLGFSEDSRYFLFGQYGIDQEKFLPYADIFAVDVHTNEFIKDGTKSRTFNVELQAGQDGEGAMLTLLREMNPLVEARKINHMMTGRMVYLLVNGDEPKSRLEFRDFKGGNKYTVSLVQEAFGSGKDVSAAFHINLSVTGSDGKVSTYTIGLPNYKREGVRRYRIKEVLFSPDESALVFVVEKEMISDTGVDVRFMVETVKL